MRGLAYLHGSRFPKKRPSVGLHTRFSVLPDKFETRFLKLFYKETRETVWPLVDKLGKADRRLPVVQAALNHGLSQEELFSFQDIVSAKDLDSALSALRSKGFGVSEKDISNGLKLPPSWLVLFLMTRRIGSSSQTGPMLDMVFSYLKVAPFHLKPSILVMATLALARWNVLTSLRLVVETFLTIPLSYPTLQFNLLLQAISRFPSSVEAANQVVAVLAAMKSRQVPLHSRTYDALLSDRFVTLQLVKTLRARMIHDGFLPTAAHLEAYLRVFAKNGAIHDAKQYLDAIHDLTKSKQGPRAHQDANLNSTHPQGPPQSLPAKTADTLYIGAFRDDRASAFQYLSNLLKIEKEKPIISDDVLHRSHHLPRFRLPSSKKRVDIYDWTTALAVAARDKTTSSETLIKLFQNASTKTTNFRPTIATYTVIIRGLLHRQNYTEAERFWTMLLRESVVLDQKALNVGLQVLTRIGDPLRAFETLESFAAKPNNVNNAFPSESRTGSSHPSQSAIKINTIVMNEFMVSLLRIGRPDVVFKLWENMKTLYGISPETVTLNILLKAARLSAKLDNSFSGAFAQLAYKNPFRSLPVRPLLRQDIVSTIQHMLANENGYRTTMWNSIPAWQWVIKIFQQVVQGNWPGLSTVRAPAKVMHLSGKFNTMHSLRELVRKVETDTGDQQQEFRAGSGALYPEIFPTDDTFFAYILLLGVHSLATEIPLALAWMRTLDIEPSINTLSIALVFWAEVSLHGPLIESLVGERSEYTKLARWIRDWVGDEKAPNDDDIRHWLKVVATIRAHR